MQCPRVRFSLLATLQTKSLRDFCHKVRARQHARQSISTMQHVPQHCSARFLDMVMTVKRGSIFISFAAAATLTAVRDCRQFAKKNLTRILAVRSGSFEPQPPRFLSTTAKSQNTVQHALDSSGEQTLFLVVQPSDLDVIFSITNSATVIVNIRECFLSSNACSDDVLSRSCATHCGCIAFEFCRVGTTVVAAPWKHVLQCTSHRADGRPSSQSFELHELATAKFLLEYLASAGVACSAEVHSAKVRWAPQRGPAREEICFTSAPDVFSVSMKQENPREAGENIARGKVLEKWVTH